MSESEGRALFEKHFGVPRETSAKLERYAELLTEWNEKFNLISESTLPHIWVRHFLDSAQLFPLIPPTAGNIADLGSGAGFPGIVLSIMGAPHVTLIESTGKKANFLRAVIEELGLSADVRQERAEAIRDMKPDVVTARALAPLSELLEISTHLIHKDILCLFLKGRNVDAELTESAKYWRFDCEKKPSLSDASGSVLILRNIKNAVYRKKPSRRAK